jgi:hypothetical protein
VGVARHKLVDPWRRQGRHLTGEEVVSPIKLRFRSEEEQTESLRGAGFTVERVYGDWDRRPAGPTSRELIVVAAR